MILRKKTVWGCCLTLGLTLSVAGYAGAATKNYAGDYNDIDGLEAWAIHPKGENDTGPYSAVMLDGNGNTLNINFGADVTNTPDFFFGGLSQGGSASNNTINFNGGNVNKSIIGGYSIDRLVDNWGDVSSGDPDAPGEANNNVVNMNSGTITGSVLGGVAEYSKGNASNNVVNIYDGVTIKGYVSGGYSEWGDATGNVVNVYGGTVEGYIAGSSVYTGSGTAGGNSINITGGEVKGGILGAYPMLDTDADMGGNTITITGGKVGGAVIGSQSIGAASDNQIIIGGDADLSAVSQIAGGFSSNNDAANNIIVIGDNAKLKANVVIVGGYGGNASGDFSGSTLKIDDYAGTLNAKTVAEFDNYDIVLGDNFVNSGDTTVISTTNAIDLTGANVNVSINNNGLLETGTGITLFDNIVATVNNDEWELTVTQGSGVIYQVDKNGGGITIAGAMASPQAKAWSEGRLANLVFLNQKNDLIGAQALPFVANAFAANSSAQFIPFAMGSGGRAHYTTGSSITVKGFSGVAGVAYRPASTGLTLGAFFEAGWGDYDSRNSFNNAPSVKGDGDTEYYGGGVMARYDFTGGLYTQGSLSAGKADVDFKGHNFIGGAADYDSSSTYYSAHIGVGYMKKFTEKLGSDFYARYLWTRQDSDSVNIGVNRVSFKETDSHRTQLGLRLDYDCLGILKPYAGAAWEYEFGSKAKASVNGLSANSPDVKGSTGMFELGLTLNADTKYSFFIDAGVQGYVGKREGVSGSIKVGMGF